MRLVDIKGLKVEFAQHGADVQAVRGISLHVDEGESLGIVGESGSGKSVTFLALMRLLGATAKVSAESMRLDSVDVLRANRRTLSAMRGRSAAMVFQDPMTAFDPVFTIGHQIAETIRTHRRVSRYEAMTEAEHLLRRVEIGNAADVLGYYPHQMSGGMLQRAMIAMALSCRPKLLIADEPTTALDVTIQAQILQLIKELQAEFGMALVMITHDLGVIAETVDRVVVMYGGRVMEQGPVQQIFDAPAHSYTQSLLQSLRAGEIPQQRDAQEAAAPALELRGLSKTYQVKRRGRMFHSQIDVHAVRDVSFVLPQRSIVGLVGESGSGKSTTGMMAMRLIDPTGGQVFVNGDEISRLEFGVSEVVPPANADGVSGQLFGARPDDDLDADRRRAAPYSSPDDIAPADAACARLARKGGARPQFRSAISARAFRRAAAARGDRARSDSRTDRARCRRANIGARRDREGSGP